MKIKEYEWFRLSIIVWKINRVKVVPTKQGEGARRRRGAPSFFSVAFCSFLPSFFPVLLLRCTALYCAVV
jgi:hypothetical protein